MPTRAFAITADEQPVTLSGSSADIAISIANSSGKPLRGLVRLAPIGGTKPEWLQIAGELERSFVIDETHQFLVKIAAPAGTPPGKYQFRLNVASVQNPDDEYAEGPVVSFVVAAPPAPAPVPARKSRWWLWLVLAGVLVAGAAGVYCALRPNPKFKVTPERPMVGERVLFEILNEGTFSAVAWEFPLGHAVFTDKMLRPEKAQSAALRASGPKATAETPAAAALPAPTASRTMVHIFEDAGPHSVTLRLRVSGIESATTQSVLVRPRPIEIPATRLASGSKGLGVGSYGPTVVYNIGDGHDVAVYEVVNPAPVPLEFRLEATYTAAESRPVVLSVNGKQITDKALAEVTGNWAAGAAKTFPVATVTLKPGANTVTFTRDAAFPHLIALRFTAQ